MCAISHIVEKRGMKKWGFSVEREEKCSEIVGGISLLGVIVETWHAASHKKNAS